MYNKTREQDRYVPDTVIVSIDEYANGTIIVNRELVDPPKVENTTTPKRGKIMNFTQASRARLAWIVTETQVEFRSFLTLTLPEESWDYVNGKKFKAAQNIFNQSLRRRNVLYLWFLEFTKRDVPHLHYFLNISPEQVVINRKLLSVSQARHAMALSWLNAITSKDALNSTWLTDDVRSKFFLVHEHLHKSHGEDRYAWELIRKPDGAKRYALKYGLKSSQKNIPPKFDGFGRWYGYSRYVKSSISEPRRVPITEDELRNKLSFLSELEFVPKIIFPRGGQNENS